MQELTIRRPDDWHLHLRDGDMLESVLPHTSRHFARAIVMPNLVPPVATTADARAYRQRIEKALPEGDSFTPIMTLYLTEDTQAEDVVSGFQGGTISAVKLYPAGATTNSHNGVRDIEAVYPVLERMAEAGVPLCVHGEVTDSEIDIFDREAVFIERVLHPIRQHIPGLRIIMEHITTSDGIDYVESSPEGIAGTITTHHLIINRNAILVGGIKPHYYCLPIAKRESHRLALRRAATSGKKRFFLGTDSAPHLDTDKESACGCAGVFSSINTLSCLAHVFEEEDALDRLEAFVSLNGPGFYGLPVNEETIRLVRRQQPVDYPERIETASGPVTVFDPMFPLYWDVA
ncbi:dihydroorotase [Hoeflea prorocentri]|uniref:Dihydroorotase n=1 Tax=Hoeflea prorocentri TaxID=1922333 RepID=A0A9X3UP85_9HYPH|nr:dihydroorotase [Hoeflea prorocentri]MCY6382686.1 dihydroorotase [Hoeflea prorocentri]MDA5400486.1 dihydroorotase [Hoeflea prorocentri]